MSFKKCEKNFEKEFPIDSYVVIGIAVALSMDAFAVAIASGIRLKEVGFRQTFRLSWHFGLFQALMPIAGWAAGTGVYSFIKQIDHWIAFSLLAAIGVKMAKEGIAPGKDDKRPFADPTRGFSLVFLSVATSLDAFAVGLSLSMLEVSIWSPAVIIGIITLAFTALGIHLGKWITSYRRIGDYAEIIGGILLIGIGIKILWDHRVFG